MMSLLYDIAEIISYAQDFWKFKSSNISRCSPGDWNLANWLKKQRSLHIASILVAPEVVKGFSYELGIPLPRDMKHESSNFLHTHTYTASKIFTLR